jgi:hypothetical protein
VSRRSRRRAGLTEGVDVGRKRTDGSLPGVGVRRTLFGFIIGLVHTVGTVVAVGCAGVRLYRT